MMAAPREHEGIPFGTDAMRATLAVLFADSGLGRVWFMLDDGVVAGYAMGT